MLAPAGIDMCSLNYNSMWCVYCVVCSWGWCRNVDRNAFYCDQAGRGEREIFHLFVLIVSLTVTLMLHHMFKVLKWQTNTQPQHQYQPQVGRYNSDITELDSRQ